MLKVSSNLEDLITGKDSSKLSMDLDFFANDFSPTKWREKLLI